MLKACYYCEICLLLLYICDEYIYFPSKVRSCLISAVNFFPSEVTCISDEFIQRWIYVHSELTSCFNSAVNFFFLARWQIRLCISDEFLQRWIYFHSELLTLEHIGRLVSSFICINEMKMQFKTTSSVLNMPFNVHVCCERGGAFNYHLRGRSQVNLTKIDD